MVVPKIQTAHPYLRWDSLDICGSIGINDVSGKKADPFEKIVCSTIKSMRDPKSSLIKISEWNSPERQAGEGKCFQTPQLMWDAFIQELI